MQIVTLLPDQPERIEQTARILHEVFSRGNAQAWPTMESARDEVQAFFAAGRVIRVAVDDAGTVLGWIGAISDYDGHAWELHPLVVAEAHQKQGIGKALVQDLEAQVRARGGGTLHLGTDDCADDGPQPSLGGVDLYPDLLAQIANIKNLRNHPYEFYQRMGFVIVGVLPDANGFGKPDIFMAKRIA